MVLKKLTTADRTSQSVALADFSKKILVPAGKIGIMENSVKAFPLDHAERAIAIELLSLSTTIKKKLAKKSATFTFAEADSIALAIAGAMPEVEPRKHLNLLFAGKKLVNCLQANLLIAELPTRHRKPMKKGPSNWSRKAK